MDHISRRNFVKKTARITSGVVVLGSSAKFLNSCMNPESIRDTMKVIIPMPLQVVIDDVGWWSGEDGSKRQEPYRTGINRNHVPADYKAIADLGRALGIRPQAAMIMCEWDKENILRNLPSATWMGAKWDNSKWLGPWMEEAAEIIRSNQEFFELTLHGVGHEYWEGGTFTRAEWTDSKGQMRPPDQVEKHLDFYGMLMEQHNLGSFPKSFVPAAFRHSFGISEGREVSLAEILQRRGINYINTPFISMFNKERAQYGLFGFDANIMTIDRGEDEFQWTVFPGDPKSVLKGPTCGLHWPNLLHPDPEQNPEIVARWVNFLKPYNENPDTLLAKNSITFQHQLAHRQLTKTLVKRNAIELDFTETDKLPGDTGKGEMTLKIESAKPLKFKSDNLKILSESLSKTSESLYVLNLERTPGKAKGDIQFRLT
jgi:hypothetical protein